jgi:rhamnosyltransferase
MKKSEIAAIITTYYPDEGLVRTLDIICNQVGKVIIMDNTDNIDKITALKNQIDVYPNKQKIFLIQNRENKGIAYTCNKGSELAIKEGFGYVITFDQDSTPPENMIDEMIKIYQRATQEYPEKKVGIVCPTYYFESVDTYERTPNGEKDFCFTDGVFSSGCLMDLKIFKESNIWYDEELFIDYFDTDFFKRIKLDNWKVVECSKIVMNHRIGNQKKVKIFGKYVIPLNYSPIRYYYAWRNKWRVYGKVWRTEKPWILKDFKAQVAAFVKMLFTEKDKIKKIRMSLLGIFHAIIGRYGKKP